MLLPNCPLLLGPNLDSLHKSSHSYFFNRLLQNSIKFSLARTYESPMRRATRKNNS